MKATIERATLLKGLGHVHSVVERRNTIPILSNVLIEAEEEGGLRLMATIRGQGGGSSTRRWPEPHAGTKPR